MAGRTEMQVGNSGLERPRVQVGLGAQWEDLGPAARWHQRSAIGLSRSTPEQWTRLAPVTGIWPGSDLSIGPEWGLYLHVAAQESPLCPNAAGTRCHP